jgi:ParB-like chromosome segregation protein Spo0J
MHIEMRPIGSITPYEDNPRLNDAAVDAVAASIRAFGWRVPIVCDENFVIIAGHTRYKAAMKLGLIEVPIHVAVGLTPEQARAYRIADNQTATLSHWDDGKLVTELMALQTAGFDLDLTGFTAEDLARLMPPADGAGQGDPDEVPDLPADPETRPGDLWLLGRHRLLCGDATKEGDLDRLMAGATADLLLTDPPYGVGYVGRTKDELTIENDYLDDDEAYRRFLAAALGGALAHVRPGGGFYVWHADVRGQHLEGHAPAQCLLLGLVHDPHPAPADLAQDAIVTHLLETFTVNLHRVADRTRDIVGAGLEVLDHEHGFEHVADFVGQVGVAVAILLDGRLLAAFAAGQELVGE